MWEASTNGPGIIRFHLENGFTRELRVERPVPLIAVVKSSVTNINQKGKSKVTTITKTNQVHIYEGTLTDLQPGSVYYYSVELAGCQTPEKNFKTLQMHPGKVTFIAYGDSRNAPDIHRKLAGNFKKHAPDFILHTGDLVGGGKKYEVWGEQFFAPLDSVIDEIPILPVIGNHEDDGTNFLRYLHLPGKELWFSFDYGPVHVLGLDYRFEKAAATNEQLRFARQDLLGSRAPWKIVVVHYPVYNVGGHESAWGHKGYLPLFHEAKVNLVIAGHSHLYERFHPVVPRNSPYSSPILHITTGGGGAPLKASRPHPTLACHASTNHFVLLEASRDTLQGATYTANGDCIDSFEFHQDKGGAGDYMALLIPKELLRNRGNPLADSVHFRYSN